MITTQSTKQLVLDRMAKLPDGATHVGLADVPALGVTVVAAGEDLEPHVADPSTKLWHRLLARTGQPVIQPGKLKQV